MSESKTDEPFAEQELKDAYLLGRLGFARTVSKMDEAASQSPDNASKAEVQWDGKIAGFDGYHTVGVSNASGDFVMEVVPTVLKEKAGSVRSNSDAILSFMFRPLADGKYRLDISEAMPGINA